MNQNDYWNLVRWGNSPSANKVIVKGKLGNSQAVTVPKHKLGHRAQFQKV